MKQIVLYSSEPTVAVAFSALMKSIIDPPDLNYYSSETVLANKESQSSSLQGDNRQSRSFQKAQVHEGLADIHNTYNVASQSGPCLVPSKNPLDHLHGSGSTLNPVILPHSLESVKLQLASVDSISFVSPSCLIPYSFIMKWKPDEGNQIKARTKSTFSAWAFQEQFIRSNQLEKGGRGLSWKRWRREVVGDHEVGT